MTLRTRSNDVQRFLAVLMAASPLASYARTSESTRVRSAAAKVATSTEYPANSGMDAARVADRSVSSTYLAIVLCIRAISEASGIEPAQRSVKSASFRRLRLTRYDCPCKLREIVQSASGSVDPLVWHICRQGDLVYDRRESYKDLSPLRQIIS